MVKVNKIKKQHLESVFLDYGKDTKKLSLTKTSRALSAERIQAFSIPASTLG